MHVSILGQDPGLEPPSPLTPAKEAPHNLPRRLTSFVGRDAERARVTKLLDQHRLVTVVGAGGIGKTRLALEVARALHREHPGGTWLVELTTVADSGQVVRAVASSAGVREHPEHTLTDLLVGRFQGSPTLLVLDNCEHLLDSVAGLAQMLLESCAQLTILATSRERLSITGEALEPLPGLDVPAADVVSNPPVAASDAERLFLDRALATHPDKPRRRADLPTARRRAAGYRARACLTKIAE